MVCNWVVRNSMWDWNGEKSKCIECVHSTNRTDITNPWNVLVFTRKFSSLMTPYGSLYPQICQEEDVGLTSHRLHSFRPRIISLHTYAISLLTPTGCFVLALLTSTGVHRFLILTCLQCLDCSFLLYSFSRLSPFLIRTLIVLWSRTKF